MEQLIKKSDVCEILADMYPSDGEKVVSIKEIDKAYDKVLDLSPVNPNTWISVTDRLPEEIGMYLVTLDYEEHGKTVSSLWFHGREIGWHFNFSDSVIAWMPLPKPFKKEGE